MVIHHDKIAYGKLAPKTEELSEKDVLNMIELLNREEDKGEEGKGQKCPEDKK